MGYAFVLWSMTLWLMPVWIVQLELWLGIPKLRFQFQAPVAWGIFVVSAIFNLSSALTMTVVGKGTPLPVDCAPRLVVKGLYRYVRNPMAIGGLGMGYAVGIGFGSIGVTIYVTLGMLIWNYFVRPIEERDLLARFGQPYQQYCQQVQCWFPTFQFVDVDEA